MGLLARLFTHSRLAGIALAAAMALAGPVIGARTASAATVAPAAAGYLRLADQGLHQQSARWRTSVHSWYCESLGCSGAYPLLTIWGVVRMFEAADALELAAPSGAHRAMVDRFAGQAERLYWNHYLHGYDPYPGDDYPAAQAWFDDNGWLGLAFVDAYRATGERRWERDAARALDFIAQRGWSRGGGMWWNTQHEHLSGEALAADSLLGMLLYGATHKRSYLDHARAWIDWANRHDIGFRGLYDSQGPGSTVIDYVEAPLIYAQYLLCKAVGNDGYCSHAAAQAQTMSEMYGVQYNLAPLYDSIYFQWMMQYAKAVGATHWLSVAQANAAAATRHAADGRGLWLGSWWGGAIADRNTAPGMFRTMAGTTSLYAWLGYFSS